MVDTINVGFGLLNFVGINPFETNTYSRIRFIIVLLLILKLLIAQVLETVKQWESLHMKTLQNAEALPIGTMAIMSLLNFYYNRHQFNKILKRLMHMRLKQNLNNNGYTFGIFLTFYIYFAVVVMSVILTMPIFFRQLPIQYYVFCDISKSIKCYTLMYILILISECALVPATLASDFFFVNSIDTFQREFIGLRQMIVYAIKTMNLKQLKEVIDKHNFALETATEFSKVYSIVLLYQYLCSTCSICIGIYLMNADGFPPSLDNIIKYTTFIGAFLVQLMIYCTGGTVLTESSISISQSAFESDWWKETQPEIRESLVLVITRSQKPALMSIGGMGSVNLGQFPQVLRTALSFYTFILNVSSDVNKSFKL